MTKSPSGMGQSGRGVGVGVGMGGHFEHCSIDDVTSTLGCWDEQTVVSYGDDDILFSVFHFPASLCPRQSSLLLFSQPCSGMLFKPDKTGLRHWAKLRFPFFLKV